MKCRCTGLPSNSENAGDVWCNASLTDNSAWSNPFCMGLGCCCPGCGPPLVGMSFLLYCQMENAVASVSNPAPPSPAPTPIPILALAEIPEPEPDGGAVEEGGLVVDVVVVVEEEVEDMEDVVSEIGVMLAVMDTEVV